MTDIASVEKFCWNEMEKERVTNLIERRIVCGEKTMVAHVSSLW